MCNNVFCANENKHYNKSKQEISKIPKISVLMSVYKEKKDDLCSAIDSILNQTFSDFEFLIALDNPNNKELREVLEHYKELDARIRVIYNEKNIGLAKTLNKTLEIARAEVVARMDADDISMPDRLQKEYSFMIKHPDCKVVSVNKINIDENGKIISYGGRLPTSSFKIEKGLHYINMILHPGVMFNRNYILSLGGYRDIVPAEDHDLWLRVARAGGNICILNEYLMKYRTSSNNISSNTSLRMWFTDKYVKKINRKKNNVIKRDELNRYLKKHGCNKTKRHEQFKKANLEFNKARSYISNKYYGKAFMAGAKSIIYSPVILDMIICSICYKLIEQ